MILKACLNGARVPGTIPGLPVTPEAVARDAEAARAAGADAVHVHPRDEGGHERLDAGTIGLTTGAIRDAAPGLPVGVSTGAWIEPDLGRRLESIVSWDILPDFASVNFHETGAEEVAALLLDRGVGIEVGLWTEEAALRFARSGLAAAVLRVLIEPMEPTAGDALVTARGVERVLDEAGIDAPRLLHGTRASTWEVLRDAAARGLSVASASRTPIGCPTGLGQRATETWSRRPYRSSRGPERHNSPLAARRGRR